MTRATSDCTPPHRTGLSGSRFGPVLHTSYSIRTMRASRKKEVLNSDELARKKFDALFAPHDTKKNLVTAERQKRALKAFKLVATKNIKPQ
jgi:hypothetical protein